MPPSIAPAPFYGDKRTTLDMIQRIRISRLVSKNTPEYPLKEKKLNPKLSSMKSHYKGDKLFTGVKHSIKKPKPKKLLLKEEKTSLLESAAKSSISIRQKMRNKFDFSRTPYAISARKPRIALDEESSKKRKFFKSTIEIPEQKRSKLDENLASEFEDINDVEDEPFAEIKKDVSNIIHQVDWFDDEICFGPQLTRQKACDLANAVSSPNRSYITLTNISPSVKYDTSISAVSTHISSENSNVNQFTSITTKSNSEVSRKSENLENAETDENNENNAEIAPQQKKYFPLFSSASKNILSDVTNKFKKQKSSLNKAAASDDQYQIDAGQKLIGPIECSKCKMVYDISDPFDKERHDQYHENRNELKYRNTKTENVVGYCGTDRIILIKHSEEKKRKRVINILRITEEEIGKGYSFESSSMAYIYVRNDTILGCLIAEPNVEGSRIIKSEGIVLLSEEWHRVKCGINRIWVKSEFRGQKIATELMNCLRKNFRYGEYLTADDIAFSVTTPDGHAFARNYMKRDDYLAYLGSNMK